jgi:hypothetical protein
MPRAHARGRSAIDFPRSTKNFPLLTCRTIPAAINRQSVRKSRCQQFVLAVSGLLNPRSPAERNLFQRLASHGRHVGLIAGAANATAASP